MFAEAYASLPDRPASTTLEEYRLRQQRLVSQFRNDDLLILCSPKMATHSNDVHYRYRTTSDLLYLTGWVDPEATLVMRCVEGTWMTHLFVQPKDTLKEIWEGRRPGTEGAEAKWPIDEAFSCDERNSHLTAWMNDAR
ncbi:MAG: aminopeptidase P N-terminal domain-containing protein, partial [Poseidonia sp.]